MAASNSVVLHDPKETSEDVLIAAGFLAGYSGRTRRAYALDLHHFYLWCGWSDRSSSHGAGRLASTPSGWVRRLSAGTGGRYRFGRWC
jgi:hypothetical protein